MPCNACGFWKTGSATQYGNGETITHLFPKPRCEQLNGTETDPDFHCNRYEEEGAHQQLASFMKGGAPWEHWVPGPCPECNAAGSKNDSGCHRCAGTGKVRYYDDGFVGEEQHRIHPMEIRKQKMAKAEELKKQYEALMAEAHDQGGP